MRMDLQPWARQQLLPTFLCACLAWPLFAGEPISAPVVEFVPEPPVTSAADDSPAPNLLAQAPNDANSLSALEQLLAAPVEVPAMQQVVTTVTGEQSTVGRSPAAVFVVTQEMIRRSGATCIPEALRMVPGLQVARVSSSQWAITSRGFNTNSAGFFASNNKLLVLIDGRTVYSPFFAGTYWDVQDVLLDDVDRIEVIRGPGATIWGANAVNGVISVITKRASETQGVLARGGGGTFERGFTSGRVGGEMGPNAHYRVYGKWFDRAATFSPTLPPLNDWQQARGGMRIDWTPSSCDTFTVQGEGYSGQDGFRDTVPPLVNEELVQGGNVLGRWTRTFDEDDDMTLQMYYDRADRSNNAGLLDQAYDTYDVDFRRHIRWDAHDVVWGLSYRSVHDSLAPRTAFPFAVVTFAPPERTYDTASAFAQDEITLTENLFATLGAKLQNNDFTGWEVQPSARLLYSSDPSWATWAAISRAVRTPSRLEQDGRITLGGVNFISFSPTFDAEEMIAYELGYRQQLAETFSWDIALFYNQYENLQSLSLTPPVPPGLPIFNANDNRGEGYGVELSAQWDLAPCWRLTGAYSFLQLQIHPGAGSVDSGVSIEGSSPQNQVYMMLAHDFTEALEGDLMARYVDVLPFQQVPSYIEIDARLAWYPRRSTELALVGQNLLDAYHPEFGANPRNEIPRGVYGMITQTW